MARSRSAGSPKSEVVRSQPEVLEELQEDQLIETAQDVVTSENPDKPSEKSGCCCCCTNIIEAPKQKEFCTFEVWMSRVRVTQGQVLDGKLELTLTGYADGTAIIHPSASTWMQVKKDWSWVAVNRYIKTITIEKGAVGYVQVSADATEWDIGLSGAAEIGTGDPVMLSYQCGQPPMTGVTTVDLKKIKNTGSGKGKVEVEFKLYQVS